MFARLRLGVSECLLGRPVRYDGGAKHDRYLTHTLGRWVEWVAVCPEVEIGLGTPRPAMDLVKSGTQTRLVVWFAGEDLTDRMEAWIQRKLGGLGDLDGFVFKGGSPSCGLRQVRVYPEGRGRPRRNGVGIFARALIERYPLLPVEEDGRLADSVERGSFIDRLYAMRRWRDFLSGSPSAAELMAFHAASEMTLLSHHEQKYRELGRLVADAGERQLEPLLEEYGVGYAETLKHPATRRRHLNVLRHLAGQLKQKMGAADRGELHGLLTGYGEGKLPRVAPLQLLRRDSGQHGSEWARSQTYLNPFPDDLLE